MTAIGGGFNRSPDNLVSARQHRWRDSKADGLGGLEVDNEVEPIELLDWQGSGIGAQEDALDMLGREAADRVVACAIAGKSPLGGALVVREHCRQPLRPRSLDDPL